MPRYRKKPVAVEAWQVTPRIAPPAWVVGAMMCRPPVVVAAPPGGGLEIRTLEGVMRADEGDWIIQGVRGELYPCKPGIFSETYEPADGHETACNGLLSPVNLFKEIDELEGKRKRAEDTVPREHLIRLASALYGLLEATVDASVYAEIPLTEAEEEARDIALQALKELVETVEHKEASK